MFTLSALKNSKEKICQQYWDYGANGFDDLNLLAQSLGMSLTELEKAVKKGCLAYVESYVCDGCGDPLKYFQVREDFWQEQGKMEDVWQRKERGLLTLCIECQMKVPLNVSSLAERVLDPGRYGDLHDAFLQGVYESLDEMEFAFLQNLSLADDYGAACQKSGLSPNSGKQLFQALVEFHLVGLEQENNGYVVLPELQRALKKAVVRRSIFGSQKTETLYRYLKQTHELVIPEVLLSSFIDFRQVQSVFQEPWEEKYFYFARVDFLICDLQGIPELAVEYDGSYHRVDPRQQTRDRVKEKILNKAGLKVIRYTEQDLQHL